ncbi:MAG TPA: SAM-dependent DNA methyltransferase, partial [Ginsengibacter sp.]|nr:SAM-dependent DNA methyltransferase [Ginsengibacter sp.]
PASKEAQTKEIWFYDFRTNIHFTLKKNPMQFEDLKDFIECYHPANINKRKETYHPETKPDGRWRRFTRDEIMERDKTSLDITWIKDKSLTDLDNLPDPDVLANDIIENLKSGIESFEEIMETINGK